MKRSRRKTTALDWILPERHFYRYMILFFDGDRYRAKLGVAFVILGGYFFLPVRSLSIRDQMLCVGGLSTAPVVDCGVPLYPFLDLFLAVLLTWGLIHKVNDWVFPEKYERYGRIGKTDTSI